MLKLTKKKKKVLKAEKLKMPKLLTTLKTVDTTGNDSLKKKILSANRK